MLNARKSSDSVKSEMEGVVMALALVMGYLIGSSGQQAAAFRTETQRGHSLTR